MADKESRGERIFPGIPLPKWDVDQFFRLWQNATQPRATDAHRDAFSRMLMVLVADIICSKSWWKTLTKNSIDPQFAASDVMSGIIRKVLRFKMKTPCPLAFISSMNHAVSNQLISVCRSATRKTAIKSEQVSENWESLTPSESACESQIKDLGRRLAEMTTEVCGNSHEMQACYREMCASILNGNHLPRYNELANGTHQISADEYLTLVVGINQLSSDFAADADVAGAHS